MSETQKNNIKWGLEQYNPIADRVENSNNVIELMRQHASSIPDKEAVVIVSNPNKPETAQSISFKQLDSEVCRVASHLQKNYPTGSRVLMLYPVSIDFVITFFACLYADMIAIPAPMPGKYQHERRRLKSIAENAGIVVVCTSSKYLDSVCDWQMSEDLQHIDCLETDRADLGNAESWQETPVQQSTLALLQYTSGSTGDPKGVMISHQNLLHNAATICRSHRVTSDYRFGGWIPLYHDMGLMGQLLPALFTGSTCVMMTPTNFLKRPYYWLAMIDKYNIQHSCAPNFAFELCYRRITDKQLAELDLSRWLCAVNGSEPIQASSINEFAKRLAPAGFNEKALCPCYGMAEATVFISGFASRKPVILRAESKLLEQHQLSLLTDDQPGQSLVGCGVPFAYDVRIVDPESRQVLPEGSVGEIWLSGKSVAAGYWNNQQATIDIFQATTLDNDGNNYLRTGDFGLLYEDEIYITGRIKEMLIVHGRNHYPQDIEHQLRLQYSELHGRFGAVFSLPLTEHNEAIIVTHELQKQQDQDELQQLASDIKASLQQEFGFSADAILLLRSGSVRRTTSGKVQRTVMRELFKNNELTPVYAEMSQEITALLKQHEIVDNRVEVVS